ncbi:MAG: peptide-methionine (S)-S-oxide reductase MsrA [Segetibacter sp.]
MGNRVLLSKAEGVISTAVGYIGGTKENPTYEEVCTGRTGHAEATEVTYYPSETSYENMVKLFYETHDPGQMNRQGPDIGTQYRSAIFYKNDEQKAHAEKLTEQLKAKGYKVVTEITKAGIFYKAENYHQKYYSKGGGSPYCHRYIKKF